MAGPKKETRRGHPEAIAKRRAARALNTLFERGGSDAAMDGRQLKRKRRLIKELQEGRDGEPLKAHQILTHVTELIAMGETLTSIRKLKPQVPATPPLTPGVVDAMRYTQQSYNFHPAAWKVLGVDIEKLMQGASQAEQPAAAGKKKKRKKKAA